MNRQKEKLKQEDQFYYENREKENQKDQSFFSRILLVEDNETNQQVALCLLEKLGLCADIARSGVEAIKALSKIDYDLVLMDIQMPEMDGYEATRQIRNPSSPVLNHQIPIVAMTANAMQSDRAQCLSAGMDDYIPKPVDMMALKRVLYKSRIEIFDSQSLMRRLQNDYNIARKVIGIFLKDTPLKISELQEHLEAGQAKKVEVTIHAIKGAAASVSGSLMKKIAFEMEDTAKIGDLLKVSKRMEDLKEAFVQLQTNLSEWSQSNE
jgi:CheY-like chemotaxis protein